MSEIGVFNWIIKSCNEFNTHEILLKTILILMIDT